MSRKIRLKRGALKDLPQLELGEPGVATDEGTMFIGTDRGNIRLANQEDLAEVSQQLADKLNKGESGAVTWAMAAQDFREQITGGNTAVVGVNAVLEENIVNNEVTSRKLSRSKFSRPLPDPTPYTTTYQDNYLLVPNEPLEAGLVSFAFHSGKTGTGYLYLMEKGTGTGFIIKESMTISVQTGENYIETPFLSIGAGSEYLGFMAIGIKTDTKSTTGPGRYQLINYDGVNKNPTLVDNTASTWDMAYSFIYAEQEVTRKVSALNSTVNTVESDLKKLDVNIVELKPFNLLRYEKSEGNFSAVPDAYFFGRWFPKTVNGSECVTTFNQGAEILFKVSGTSTVALELENMANAEVPQVVVSVDGGEFTRMPITYPTTIASGLSTGEHVIRVMVEALSGSDNKWTGGVGVAVKGIGVEAGGTVTPVKPYNRYALALGDSITEGVSVITGGGTVPANSASQAFPAIACNNLNTACIRVGFRSSGVLVGGAGGVPPAIQYVDYAASGIPEDAQNPDFIIVNLGQNDTATGQAFEDAYTELIQRLRIKYPGIYIFCMTPFSGKFAGRVEIVANKFENTVYVDTSSWNVSTNDTVHPDIAGHLEAGTKLAEEIKGTYGTHFFMK